MNLIFDFDGTLVNSIGSAVDMINEIFTEIGQKKTNTKEVKEKGLKGLIKDRNISIIKVNKFISDYRKRSDKIYETTLPFKGISSALTRLSDKNRLGILTTNKINVVQKFIHKHGLDYFIFVHSEKKLFGKDKGLKNIISKYRLNPKETFYIGDETRDIEAAKKAKIRSIAVIWGAESKELLEKSEPDMILTKPSDLLKIWN